MWFVWTRDVERKVFIHSGSSQMLAQLQSAPIDVSILIYNNIQQAGRRAHGQAERFRIFHPVSDHPPSVCLPTRTLHPGLRRGALRSWPRGTALMATRRGALRSWPRGEVHCAHGHAALRSWPRGEVHCAHGHAARCTALMATRHCGRALAVPVVLVRERVAPISSRRVRSGGPQ
mgnify:CR=1 FL=1